MARLTKQTQVITGRYVPFAVEKERYLNTRTVIVATKAVIPVDIQDLSRTPTQIIAIQAVMFAALQELPRIPTPTSVIQAVMFAVQQEPPRIPTVLPIRIIPIHTGKLVPFAVEKERHQHTRTVTIATQIAALADTQDLSHTLTPTTVTKAVMFAVKQER